MLIAMRILNFLLLILLAGCASDIPKSISEPPANNLTVTQARASQDTAEGQLVRWGGEIVSVNNQQNTSLVEVLARQVGSSGKPVVDGQPDARFLALFRGFLDPVDYQPGQRISVSGTIVGTETHKIGEFPYTYPVVRVDQHYRWPANDPEPYYDPYWGPWGPWGPYPYHRYPYWW